MHIIGRDEKNYHLLQSLIAFIDLYDEINIFQSDSLNIKFNDQSLDSQDNIIIRTIQYFSEISDISVKLNIDVKKNIPIGAGLGGGSSNAATILKFLQQYYSYYLSPKIENDIALRLGCDVVAFLYSQPILVEGVGEIITPINLDLSCHCALIIYPQIINNSAVIYKKNKASFSKTMIDDKNKIDIDWLKLQKNDLTHAAFDDQDKIKNLLELLAQDQNAIFSRLSGSGSTCYALFENLDHAQQAFAQISQLFPSYWVRICKFNYKNSFNDSIF